MQFPRISITGMFMLVAIIAVLIAAFTYATENWANVVFTLLVGTLLGAIVLAIYRADVQRAFWIGFCVFGWAYAMLVFCPGLDDSLGRKMLTGEVLIRPLHLWIEPIRAGRTADPGFTPVKVNDKTMRVGPDRYWDIWGATWSRSRQIGNSAGTLLWAVIGGLLARWAYGVRQKRDSIQPADATDPAGLTGHA